MARNSDVLKKNPQTNKYNKYATTTINVKIYFWYAQPEQPKLEELPHQKSAHPISKHALYVYCYTHFYTAANVHFTIKRVLQITHTSLAIENSFMRSLVRGTTRPECLC